MPSTSTSDAGSGKRVFSTASKTSTGNHSTGQKIKNFFRIPSSKNHHVHTTATAADFDKASLGDSQNDGSRTPQSQSNNNKSSLRNSRFLPHIGRSRSQTVASEGNPLDDGLSPTAHANPYFQHQGPPALRHHDESSIPPSPPDTPQNPKKAHADGDASGLSGKEELARKLRRVASAPNAQGLFSKMKGGSSDSRPQSSAHDSPPKASKVNGMGQHSNLSALSMMETTHGDLLPIPGIDGIPSPGKIRNSVAFRRTYSSNSIKVRNVEVGPGSFDKIKLIGKGDVGKVYLVREKKSARLYAMKGEQCAIASDCSY
jgi:protein-serine/threonine kinase